MNQPPAVTIAEVLGAARLRKASLVPETTAYLVLAMAESVLSGRGVAKTAPSRALLEPDGGIGGAPRSEGELGRAYRAVLRALLSSSTGSMPSIAAVADPAAAAARPGLDAFVAELEAALIPLNRGAAKRGLARLHREVTRAKATQRLPAVAEELDASFGAKGAETPPLPVEARRPREGAARLDKTPIQSFVVRPEPQTATQEPRSSARGPQPAPLEARPTPTPAFVEEPFFGALEPSVLAPNVMESDTFHALVADVGELDEGADELEVEVSFTSVTSSPVAPVEPAGEMAFELIAPPDLPSESSEVELADDALTMPLTRVSELPWAAHKADAASQPPEEGATTELDEVAPVEPAASAFASESVEPTRAAMEPAGPMEGVEAVAPGAAETPRVAVPVQPIRRPSAAPVRVARPVVVEAAVPNVSDEGPKTPPETKASAEGPETPPEETKASAEGPETPPEETKTSAEVPKPPAEEPKASAALEVSDVSLAPPPAVVVAPRPAPRPRGPEAAGHVLPLDASAASDAALKRAPRSARDLVASFKASGEEQSLKTAQRSLKAYVGLALTPPPPAVMRSITPSAPPAEPVRLEPLSPVLALGGSVARRRVPLGWVLLTALLLASVAVVALQNPLVSRLLVGR